VSSGVLQMKQRRRIYYTESQRALMWERWQKGETLHQIASYLIEAIHPSNRFWLRRAEYGRRYDAAPD
jgi:hypothetical protein